MSTTFFHCSNVRSSRLIPGAPTPALLNSTSRRPYASLVRANRLPTARGSATSVGTANAESLGRSRFRDRPFQWLAAASGQDDAVAVFQECQGDGLADAGAGAGDDGDFGGRAHGGGPRVGKAMQTTRGMRRRLSGGWSAKGTERTRDMTITSPATQSPLGPWPAPSPRRLPRRERGAESAVSRRT